MNDELRKVAEFLGELCGAAQADWVQADPGDVGINGIHIKTWREAYVEGCKDMAEGIAARFPEACRDEAKQIARDAYTASYHRASHEAQEARDDQQDAGSGK